jgi:hypothetical protein
MRKTFVWALMAALLVAGSAFGASDRFDVRANATFATGGPTTTNNDDSCDIGVAPAATLLLPYFEVDITSAAGTGETTIFTITNVSQLPQVAHITLWTDYSYPVIDFNVFLTGYDVQSINLYDVIRRGQIAPDDGTGFDVSPVGELSGNTVTQTVFDNPLVAEDTCVDLPVLLPQIYVTRMQSAFTTGKVPAAGAAGACNTAGGIHANAVGYATIDVTATCSTSLPTDADYFTEEILFDNVLIGDYQQINGNEDFAQGNPMVHIRAIPEGGTAATRIGPAFAVNFDRTFYSRYQAGGVADARQPLPALWAARWISGGATGFETFFKIWREGATTSTTVCSAYPAAGGTIGITELVRFDEEENPETLAPDIVISPPIVNAPVLPETSLTNVTNEAIFPANTQDAVAGWMYMNLDAVNNTGNPPATQNWVIVSMRAEDRFSVDFDAAWLGNGCTPETDQSEAVAPTGPAIGPAPNFNPNL